MKNNQQHPEISTNRKAKQTEKNNVADTKHKQSEAPPKYLYEIMREEEEEMSYIREEVRGDEFEQRYKATDTAKNERNYH